MPNYEEPFLYRANCFKPNRWELGASDLSSRTILLLKSMASGRSLMVLLIALFTS